MTRTVTMQKPDSVDAYIAAFPAEVQARLKAMRRTIRKAAPQAEEGIAYGMPGYRLNGAPLVYFAAMKAHVGFYATPTGHAEFAKELAAFKTGKGSVQFPNGAPLPLDLVARIVAFRVAENLAKTPKAVKKAVGTSAKTAAKKPRKP